MYIDNHFVRSSGSLSMNLKSHGAPLIVMNNWFVPGDRL